MFKYTIVFFLQEILIHKLTFTLELMQNRDNNKKIIIIIKRFLSDQIYGCL